MIFNLFFCRLTLEHQLWPSIFFSLQLFFSIFFGPHGSYTHPLSTINFSNKIEQNISIQVFKNLQFWKLPKIKKTKLSMVTIFHFSFKPPFFLEIETFKSKSFTTLWSWIFVIPTFFMACKHVYVTWPLFWIGTISVKCQLKVNSGWDLTQTAYEWNRALDPIMAHMAMISYQYCRIKT